MQAAMKAKAPAARSEPADILAAVGEL